MNLYNISEGKNILIIGFYTPSALGLGYTSWGGKPLKEIRQYLDTSMLNKDNTPFAVGYVTKSEFRSSKCVRLHVKEIKNEKDKLTIKYFTGDEFDYDTTFVRDYIIPTVFHNIKYPPFCFAVPEKQLLEIVNDAGLITEIKHLMKKNDWKSITGLAGNIDDIKNKPVFWNNAPLLNMLSFAFAKLSETTMNLRKSFQDKNAMNKYLKLQKMNREITIMLRERCIELQPDNAGYYSNLGYSHYQYLNELNTPGGRRDGNSNEEAEKAVEYINKALDIDPARIPDLYRKGIILCNYMPDIILFTKGSELTSENINNAQTKIIEGIDSFKEVVKQYEMLPLFEDKRIKRYYKETVKSLFSCSRAYEMLSGIKWDYLIYYGSDMKIYQDSIFTNNDLNNINFAEEYMNKCIFMDNINISDISFMTDIKRAALYNNIYPAIYKIYRLGKYSFMKYLIMNRQGKENPEAQMYLDKAEELLLLSYSIKVPQEYGILSKAFIADLLAKIYIVKNEPEKGIEILYRYLNNKLLYYIRYTAATCFYLCNEYEKALEQVEITLQNAKQNKEMYIGYYMKYILAEKLGDIKKSKEAYELSMATAPHNKKSRLTELNLSLNIQTA